MTANVAVLIAIFIDENNGHKLGFCVLAISCESLIAIKFSSQGLCLLFTRTIAATDCFTLSSFLCWYNHGNVSGMNLEKMKHLINVINK